MSQILTGILDKIRCDYVTVMEQNTGLKPYVTAHKLCDKELYIAADQLAVIIEQDPTLLAARAGNMISDEQERENPSVGNIISTNILAAAMEALLETAVHYGWLESTEEGEILVDQDEALSFVSEKITMDYSESEKAKANFNQPGMSALNQLMVAAEKEYLQQLDNEVHEAYPLAVQVAGGHSVFSPEEIAPLVFENPLLLGLRADDLLIDEMFQNDPPAGIIISSHITQMMLDHLLELAAEKGALAYDSEGLLIMPENEENQPIIH